MHTKRIIPCLDVKNGRVVKGINFVNLKDAGDPVSVGAAYDKAGADELVFLDITASSDARNIVVDWEANGKPVEVILPVSYETAKGNNRSEIENLLINKLKESDGIRKPFHIEKSNLESYGENLFILPAESYQNKDITRNIYLDSELIPIWDSNYSNESIANLLFSPSGKYGDILSDLTILRHEYGEKETITTPVTNS